MSYLLVSATELHGREFCEYYETVSDVNETFVGKIYDFSDGQQSRRGVLTSPNYPYVYDSKMYCSWQFHLTPGQQITLNITDFILENQYVKKSIIDLTNIPVLIF